ncbi:MAG: VRR-NUC domain-containing protein, partial [Algicola sp.]|nr:VRR-NUC domain-containing protein [Algicola sp.]
MVIELPEGYYRTNFIELIEHVFAVFEDLLSDGERVLYRQFQAASEPAQKLYVRMLTRKGCLFRLDKLVYDEIADNAAAAHELAQCGLVTVNPELGIDDLLGLYSKPQWLKILAEHEIETKKLKGLKRAEFDVALGALGEHVAIKEIIVQLVESERFNTFKLLFFGNLEQDLTEFVLRDLGLYRFENTTIDKSVRLFTSREQIEQYLAYYHLLEDLDVVLTQDAAAIVALHKKLPKASAHDKILNRRIQRVNLTLARQLERVDALEQALSIYNCCQLPPARERSARILVKQDKVEDALALCRMMMDEPLCDEESVIGSEFGYRTAKKHKLPWPEPDKYQPPTETIELVQSGQGVEVDVAQHLNKNGECHFVENALFCSVFALHYWDVIFAPVRGAFTHPFQIRPHDLYDNDFVSNRLVEFEKAQALVADINHNIPRYLDLWREKFGSATPFVHWDTLDEALLTKALTRIPAAHWQAIFARLWADIRANRSGFADLILFPDIEGKSGGEDGGYE